MLLFNGDASKVAASISALKASLPKRTSGAKPTIWQRYASQTFALVTGVALTLAAVHWSWVLASLAILPIVGLLRSLGFIPRWSGVWKMIVDLATVLGAAAAIAAVFKHG
jgi:fatty acid desaturase